MTSDLLAVAEELPLAFGAPKLGGPPTEPRRGRSLPYVNLFGRNRVRRDHDLCSHLVQDRAISDSDRMAIRCGLLALSYGDLHAATVQGAQRLHSLGVRKGDRIIVVAESGFQAIALILALGELEACTLAVNARMPDSELETIRSYNVHHRMIYCAGDSLAAAVRAKVEMFRSEFFLFGPVVVQDVARPRSVGRNRKELERPTVSFGEDSRCAGLRHRRLLESASYLAGACALSADDVIYNCAPIASIEGFLATLTALHAGAGVELVAEPDPAHFVWRLNEGRVSFLIAPPPFFPEILAYAKVNGHGLRRRRLRLISSVNHAIDPDVETAVLDAFGERVRRFGFRKRRRSIARHDVALAQC